MKLGAPSRRSCIIQTGAFSRLNCESDSARSQATTTSTRTRWLIHSKRCLSIHLAIHTTIGQEDLARGVT